jgi:FMN phosphatase YigB (HAD superfamily)
MERWATLDCYGTLIDWNRGIGRELERLFGAERAGECLRRYHELEPEIQRDDPSLSYREVMAIALARLGAPAEEHDALGQALPSWEPFPEVPAALEDVRRRGWRLAILSNSDRDLIDASVARLGVPFDETIALGRVLLPRRRRPGPARACRRELVPRRRACEDAGSADRVDQPTRRGCGASARYRAGEP